MRTISKKTISRILMFVGSLCIVIPLGYEAMQYPWFTIFKANANEIQLADAAPPDFAYINYQDVLESIREGGRVSHASEYGFILPGTATRAVYEEAEPEPVEEVDPYTAYLEYANSHFILLGNMKIPRLGISENLFEGTDGQLIVGLGHTPGTALPGEEGNFVVSGHRVHALYSGKQPFRYLDSLLDGDLVSISFGGLIFTYEVYDRFIVSKYATWVLNPIDNESHALTMITCDPVIGPNDRPNRLIVRARLVSTEEEIS